MNDYLHKLIEQHHGTNSEIYSLDNDPKFVPSYRSLLKNEVEGARFFFRKWPGMPQELHRTKAMHKKISAMTDEEVVAMFPAVNSKKATKQTDIRVCVWCMARESKYGDHKTCGICMEPIYSSKDCQKKDWAHQHKAMKGMPPPTQETSNDES